jgi:hypothetical protein
MEILARITHDVKVPLLLERPGLRSESGPLICFGPSSFDYQELVIVDAHSF